MSGLNRTSAGRSRGVLLWAVGLLALLLGTLTARPAMAQGITFTQVDIGPVANHSLDWLTHGPVGAWTPSDVHVPFNIRGGSNAVFMTAQRFLENNPNQATIAVGNVPGVDTVRLLLNGSYVLREERGQKVGEVTLRFTDGTTSTINLIAWQNIRETWCYDSDVAGSCLMSANTTDSTFRNVYTESQNRGGAARAFLDMLSIPVHTSTALTSITLTDTSAYTASSVDPSILLTAITIERLGSSSGGGSGPVGGICGPGYMSMCPFDPNGPSGPSTGRVSAPPPPPPAPPPGFRTHNSGDTNLQLRWEPEPGTTVLIFSPYTCNCYLYPSPGDQWYDVTGLTPGGYYCFIAIAHNAGGWGNWTGWLCLQTASFA